MFTMLVATVFVPMVGMGIDGVRAYLVSAKLSTAIDGAAIAAASSLSSGANQAAQTANAQATATSIVNANFPPRYFGATLNSGSPNVCVDPGDGSNPCGLGTGTSVTTYKKRTVVISAVASVPTMFMRIIGFNTTTVADTGQASRRDVRVVLVIDRSDSMTSSAGDGNTAIQDAVIQAGIFVNKFAPGRDQLGLVVMGGSAIVAYPARNPALDPTQLSSFQPPDVNWNTNSPSLPYLVSQIQGGSNTGTAEALYLAYMTLKADAATNTALPDMLNVIVFFTDGLPNGLTTFANDPNDPSPPLKSTSPCANRTNGANKPMKGWFAQWNGDANDALGGKGLFTPMEVTQYPGSTSSTDITKWMQNPGTDSTVISNATGCSFLSNSDYVSHDFAKIPDVDLYGNSTSGGVNPNTYKLGNYYLTYGQLPYSNTGIGNSYQVGLASWNAALDQSYKIWNDLIWNSTTRTNVADPYPISPVIFTIGYWHTGEEPDATLMNIMANTTASPLVVSNKVNGQYFLATSADQVSQAFADIASEILRLAQ
jgi:Flp pilus assembly protein TadG